VRKAWNELETARQQFVLLDSSIAQAPRKTCACRSWRSAKARPPRWM
jgi:hypothetical protein